MKKEYFQYFQYCRAVDEHCYYYKNFEIYKKY